MWKSNTAFKIFLAAIVLLVACGRDQFPFCCDPSGTGDVQVNQTYDFGFRSRFTSLSPLEANLVVATQADLANFQAAANLRPSAESGTISGIVLDTLGLPASGITLGVFDEAGDPAGVLFYNGLGAVPDFSNTDATSDVGTFTIFDVSPGPIYLKVLKGGRGNGQVLGFPGAVSLMTMQVVRSIPNTIPITGVVSDLDTNSPLGGVRISALGNPEILATSILPQGNITGGGFNIPEGRAGVPGGLGPSLPSNGTYYVKASIAGYLDTIQLMTTNPADIQAGTADLTRFLKVQSESELASQAADLGISLDPQKGILAGVIRESDRTPRLDTEIQIRDQTGKPVGDLYYRTESVDPTDPTVPDRQLVKVQPGGEAKTSGNGEFIVFNLPPGKVYLTAVSTSPSNLAEPNKYSTSRELPVFAGSLFFIDDLLIFPNFSGGVDNNRSHSQTVTGKVRDLKGGPVNAVAIGALGFSGVFGQSDALGLYGLSRYTDDKQWYPEYPADPFLVPQVTCSPITPPNCALISSGTHIVKLTPTLGNAVTTFQEIRLSNRAAGDIRDLTILTQADLGGGLTPGTAAVAGTFFNLSNNRSVSGVTLEVTDSAGLPVGNIFYVDDSGNLDSAGPSYNNGRFVVLDIPVFSGESERLIFLTITSPDDSGVKPVRAIRDAVMVSDLVVNKSPALNADVRGTVQDLRGNPISNATGRVLGEKTVFASAADGSYSTSLQSFGNYVFRLEDSGQLSSENHQIATAVGNEVLAPLYMTSTAELTALLGGGRTQDPGLGVVAGAVLTSGFEPLGSVLFDNFSSILPQGVVGGFFNSDDKADIAIVGSPSAGGSVQILAGAGDGTLSPVQFPVVDANGNPISPLGNDLRSVGAADFNGDGLIDLVALDYGANRGSCLLGDPCSDPNAEPGIHLLLANGNGTFTPVGNWPVNVRDSAGNSDPTTLESGGIDLVVLDYDGDGISDLAVLNDGLGMVPDASLLILRGNGNGTFDLIFIITGAGMSQPRRLARGDFTGDQRIDLVVTDTGNDQIVVFPNGNEGTPQRHATGINPVSVDVGDMNLDGVLDWVVLTDDGVNAAVDLIINQQDPFRIQISLAGLPNPLDDVIVFDFDRDGRLDLLLTFPSTGQGALFFGDAAGHFSSPELFDICSSGCPGLLASAVLGFLDRDARVDLITINQNEAFVSLGQLKPLAGVRVEATGSDGLPMGEVAYFDSAGTIDLAQSASSLSGDGRFLITNVPPGLTMVRAASGGSGNAYLQAKGGELSYVDLLTVGPPPESVLSSGRVGDFVGNPISSVNVRLLGTDLLTTTDGAGAYALLVRANSRYIISLDRPTTTP